MVSGANVSTGCRFNIHEGDGRVLPSRLRRIWTGGAGTAGRARGVRSLREWGSVGLIAVVAAHLWGSCSGQNVGFDNNGNCPVGHTLCVLDEPLVSLGGVPRLSGEQPPQAAGATACAFTEDPSVNGTFLYFANTPYANLQVFASYDDGASWAHSRDIDLPCNPRGLAIDDTAADPYALFACTETGQAFSVSLATGTSQLLSSGIDF